MIKVSALRWVVVGVALGGSLVGCGGGSDELQAFTQPTKGGIWHGTDTISGELVYGIVTESGSFRFIRADGVQYAGSATFDRTAVTAAFEGFTSPGTTFVDGETHGTGSAAGSLDPGRSMGLATVFVTDAVNAADETGTLNLTYDVLYDRPSSLDTVSGNFQGTGQGVLSIATDGTVFAQFNAIQCVMNGTVGLINAAHNAYSMSVTLSGCTGGATALEGVKASGLVTLDNSAVPERLIGALTTEGGSDLGFVLSLNRS